MQVLDKYIFIAYHIYVVEKDGEEMISTITISTITLMATSAIAVGAGVIASIFLIGFLANKMLLDAAAGSNSKLIARVLYVGIIPLLITFGIIVALKISELLA
jgi:hypothetical protein